MENDTGQLRSVRKLPDGVARKIAAGEVIDRPAAVVRELLDNSIDAGAKKISVEISGGGIGTIRVTDNGFGMTQEDLRLCAQTHTTSKIREEDDLLSLSTLGFRGEALSSIDAVSSLEITTTRNGHEAWKLELGKVIPSALPVGTVVNIACLFDNFPARKQFLKRASSETQLCRQIFIEKALAWPGIEFRFSVDGEQKLFLPKAETLRERCLSALEPKESESFFYEISGSGEGFTFSAILGSPDVVRSDRRQLMVFVNGRRIMEYSLLQAMEYGSDGHFPNGSHPFGFLFVTINPALVDFNIHPAKREARFRDGEALHHAVSSVIRDFFRRYTFAQLHRGSKSEPDNDFPGLVPNRYNQGQNNSYAEAAAYPENKYHEGQTPVNPSSFSGDFRFLGQILGTFLAIEKKDMLYLVDQHAAHERILYNDFFTRSNEKQELLIPYRIETGSASGDAHISSACEKLKNAGFDLFDEGDGTWQVTAVPVRWTGTQKDLADELLDNSIEPEALVSHIYAKAACRAACKDGDILDPETARNLAEKAFALPDPVCPHGRPIWVIIDRGELFRRIRRTES